MPAKAPSLARDFGTYSRRPAACAPQLHRYSVRSLHRVLADGDLRSYEEEGTRKRRSPKDAHSDPEGTSSELRVSEPTSEE